MRRLMVLGGISDGRKQNHTMSLVWKLDGGFPIVAGIFKQDNLIGLYTYISTNNGHGLIHSLSGRTTYSTNEVELVMWDCLARVGGRTVSTISVTRARNYC